MEVGYIYRHWIINDKGIEKNYIGQTMFLPQKRWKDGKGYIGGDHKFSRAIKKYGWENFKHEIIGAVEAKTKEQLVLDLNEWEVYFIEKYNSFRKGYNSTTGGERNKAVSSETKDKISKNRKGKKQSIETKMKIGKSVKQTKTEEVKQKTSNAMSGVNNPRALKVICLNTKQIFDTVLEATKWCGLKSSSDVIYCCKGKSKTAGKHPETKERLEWMYYNEYLKQCS